MTTLTYNTTSIEIRDPRYPYQSGNRSLIIKNRTRSGGMVTGSITGQRTSLVTIQPQFRLVDTDWEALRDFITNTILDGLYEFDYEDAQNRIRAVYLEGLETHQLVARLQHTVTLSLEGVRI